MSYEMFNWKVSARVKGKKEVLCVRARSPERAAERFREKYPSARKTKNNNITVGFASRREMKGLPPEKPHSFVKYLGGLVKKPKKKRR